MTEARTYDLIRGVDGVEGIKCRFCGVVSWNPKDVSEKFCETCHIFLGDLQWMISVVGGPVGKYKEIKEIKGVSLQRLMEEISRRGPDPTHKEKMVSWCSRQLRRFRRRKSP